ncbi:hypothetical protein OAT84_02985 [Gammaproteobacteria bacterium]|nr:hypothetical protein [Gammaproteobacteria bacterium]
MASVYRADCMNNGKGAVEDLTRSVIYFKIKDMIYCYNPFGNQGNKKSLVLLDGTKVRTANSRQPSASATDMNLTIDVSDFESEGWRVFSEQLRLNDSQKEIFNRLVGVPSEENHYGNPHNNPRNNPRKKTTGVEGQLQLQAIKVTAALNFLRAAQFSTPKELGQLVPPPVYMVDLDAGCIKSIACFVKEGYRSSLADFNEQFKKNPKSPKSFFEGLAKKISYKRGFKIEEYRTEGEMDIEEILENAISLCKKSTGKNLLANDAFNTLETLKGLIKDDMQVKILSEIKDDDHPLRALFNQLGDDYKQYPARLFEAGVSKETLSGKNKEFRTKVDELVDKKSELLATRQFLKAAKKEKIGIYFDIGTCGGIIPKSLRKNIVFNVFMMIPIRFVLTCTFIIPVILYFMKYKEYKGKLRELNKRIDDLNSKIPYLEGTAALTPPSVFDETKRHNPVFESSKNRSAKFRNAGMAIKAAVRLQAPVKIVSKATNALIERNKKKFAGSVTDYNNKAKLLYSLYKRNYQSKGSPATIRKNFEQFLKTITVNDFNKLYERIHHLSPQALVNEYNRIAQKCKLDELKLGPDTLNHDKVVFQRLRGVVDSQENKLTKEIAQLNSGYAVLREGDEQMSLEQKQESLSALKEFSAKINDGVRRNEVCNAINFFRDKDKDGIKLLEEYNVWTERIGFGSISLEEKIKAGDEIWDEFDCKLINLGNTMSSDSSIENRNDQLPTWLKKAKETIGNLKNQAHSVISKGDSKTPTLVKPSEVTAQTKSLQEIKDMLDSKRQTPPIPVSNSSTAVDAVPSPTAQKQ